MKPKRMMEVTYLEAHLPRIEECAECGQYPTDCECGPATDRTPAVSWIRELAKEGSE